MGTLGTGPYDSDGALDLLEELAELSVVERELRVEDILVTCANGQGRAFPDEVIAAVALVAASLPTGGGMADFQREAVSSEVAAASFPNPVSKLARVALSALDVVAGDCEGLWLKNWVDRDKRGEATAVADRMRWILEAGIAMPKGNPGSFE